MCLPILGSMIVSVQGPDFEFRRTGASFSYVWHGVRIIHSTNPIIIHMGNGMHAVFGAANGQANGHAVGNGAWIILPTYNFTFGHRNLGGIAGRLRAVRNVIQAATQRVRQLRAAAVERSLGFRQKLASLRPMRWCMVLFLAILLIPLALAGITVLFWLGIAWLVLSGIYAVSDRAASFTDQLLGGPVEGTIAFIQNTGRNGLSYLTEWLVPTEPASVPGFPASAAAESAATPVRSTIT